MEIAYWFVAAATVWGVWLNNHRRIECFYIWLVTNLVWAFASYTHGLPAKAAQHLVFFALAVHGLSQWRKVERIAQGMDAGRAQRAAHGPPRVPSAEVVDSAPPPTPTELDALDRADFELVFGRRRLDGARLSNVRVQEAARGTEDMLETMRRAAVEFDVSKPHAQFLTVPWQPGRPGDAYVISLQDGVAILVRTQPSERGDGRRITIPAGPKGPEDITLAPHLP